MSPSKTPARLAAWALIALFGAPLVASAQAQPAPSASGEVADIPLKFTRPEPDNDYIKRVEMIPMRDGAKLYTVIVIPKAAKNAPIILTRTPYNAKARAERTAGSSMLGATQR